jgi:hypothetical protein
MKETHMTFRIEPQLRDAFAAAAERAHEPASQVLRRFMRDYVEQEGAAGTHNTQHLVKALTQHERAASVRNTEAIWALEGFVKTPDMRILNEEYIAGRLTTEAQGELVRFHGRLVGAGSILRQLPEDDPRRSVMAQSLIEQTSEFRRMADSIHPALFDAYGDL